MKELDNCRLCPRECGADRNAGQLGYCGSGPGYNIGSVCIHQGEEPPISGNNGICNIFFTGCNLQCLFCQNYQITRRKVRIEDNKYTLEKLTDIIISYIKQGIEAVGFVSPTHYSPHVKAIINRLNKLGYSPVIVYNTSGYEKVEMLKSFEGLIDVYLPDFKYFNPYISERFSDSRDYPEMVKKAIAEMYRQKGSTLVLNDKGKALTGMIIRHLVLPGQAQDSISILKWIAAELSSSVSISLMSQYYPTACVVNHPVLGKRITTEEYQEVLEAMEDLGFFKGWIQQYDSADNYIPDFTFDHPFEKQ